MFIWRSGASQAEGDHKTNTETGRFGGSLKLEFETVVSTTLSALLASFSQCGLWQGSPTTLMATWGLTLIKNINS